MIITWLELDGEEDGYLHSDSCYVQTSLNILNIWQ